MGIEYSIIPEHCRQDIKDYIERRYPVGDFLYAILTNDLYGVFRHADDINIRRIKDYVVFLYNEAPSECYGSVENVDNWLNPDG